NLARYDGIRYGLRVEGPDLLETYRRTRGQGFGEEVKRRMILGTYALSAGYYDAYYVKAQKVRTLIKDEYDRVFEKVDALVTSNDRRRKPHESHSSFAHEREGRAHPGERDPALLRSRLGHRRRHLARCR